MECLSDELLLALIGGDLGDGALADADRHLDRCEACRDIVAELARSGGGGGALPRGAEIDRYAILDVLGRGAMGVVYSAFDPELDRRVALKLVRPELASARGKLLGEARAMARLSHPNVVSVFDAGADGDTVFVAMEQIDGRSLREWLDDERPGWRAIRDAFVAAGRGLEAAHRAEIVHRDFKPDNVLVADDGRVVVGDFGLAVSDGAGGERAAGTPAYMAPEQLAGGGADARSDQYAFCASLYEALAGERPDRDAPAPIAEVPRWLDRAVARGLDADPGRRWPSMTALLSAIDRRASRLPVIVAAALGAAAIAATAVAFTRGGDRGVAAATPLCAGAADEAAQIWSPERAAELAAAIGQTRSGYEGQAIAALLAALDDWRDSWVSTRTSVCRATRIAGTQSGRLLDVRMHCLDRGARRTAALIDQVSRAGHGVLPQIPAVIAQLPEPGDCASQALTLSEPPTPDQAARLPALERRLDAVRATAAVGDHARAIAAAGPLLADAREVDYQPFVAEVLLARARVNRGLDRLAAAAGDARAAIVAAERSSAADLVAAGWIALTSIDIQRGDLDAASRSRELAAAVVDRAGAPRDLAAALAEVSGLLRYNRGDLAAAREAFERALELYGDRVEVAAVLTGLGNVDRAAGDLESALARHTRAGELDRGRYGARHPAVARSLHNQAGILRLLGRLDEALARYREALAIKLEALGGDHSEVALTRNSISLIHIARGELDEAAAELERARAIYQKVGSPELAGVLRNLGLVAERRGDRAAARARFTEALAVDGGAVDPAALRADIERVSRRPAGPPKSERPPATYMPDQAWDN